MVKKEGVFWKIQCVTADRLEEISSKSATLNTTAAMAMVHFVNIDVKIRELYCWSWILVQLSICLQTMFIVLFLFDTGRGTKVGTLHVKLSSDTDRIFTFILLLFCGK